MIKVSYPVISVLPSENMPDPGIPRQMRGANPVNATSQGKRETAPLEAMAPPRVKHPKLNTEGWYTSYAQARTEPSMSRPKSRYNRNKRTRNDKRGR